MKHETQHPKQKKERLSQCNEEKSTVDRKKCRLNSIRKGYHITSKYRQLGISTLCTHILCSE